MARVASSPFITGIEMSIKMMSKDWAMTAATAASPSKAWVTDAPTDFSQPCSSVWLTQ
jgi:hypothetical protein